MIHVIRNEEYIFDLPNIAFGPKSAAKYMEWRSSRNVARSSGQHYFPGGKHYMPAHTPGQQWLFIHVTWRALDQSRSRISDSDITIFVLVTSLLPLSRTGFGENCHGSSADQLIWLQTMKLCHVIVGNLWPVHVCGVQDTACGRFESFVSAMWHVLSHDFTHRAAELVVSSVCHCHIWCFYTVFHVSVK